MTKQDELNLCALSALAWCIGVIEGMCLAAGKEFAMPSFVERAQRRLIESAPEEAAP